MAVPLSEADIARLGPTARAQVAAATPAATATARARRQWRAPNAGAVHTAGSPGGGRAPIRKSLGTAARIRTGAVASLTQGPRVHPAVPINANGATITVAVALVVLVVLYRRGVPQAIWRAATLSPAHDSTPGNTPAIGGGSGAAPPMPGMPQGAHNGALADPTALTQAEQAVAATRPPQNWLNFCLQFFDDVRSRLGLQTYYGVPNAATVCANQHLHSGLAPAGAGVCFRGGSDGHIGLANGDQTYTSEGLPGGLQTRNYLGNPDYLGWFA